MWYYYNYKSSTSFIPTYVYDMYMYVYSCNSKQQKEGKNTHM
jgi:hypothetical protein